MSTIIPTQEIRAAELTILGRTLCDWAHQQRQAPRTLPHLLQLSPSIVDQLLHSQHAPSHAVLRVCAAHTGLPIDTLRSLAAMAQPAAAAA